MARERKVHLPQVLRDIGSTEDYSITWTACGRKQGKVAMADEPDEGHATCERCIDIWHLQ